MITLSLGPAGLVHGAPYPGRAGSSITSAVAGQFVPAGASDGEGGGELALVTASQCLVTRLMAMIFPAMVAMILPAML